MAVEPAAATDASGRATPTAHGPRRREPGTRWFGLVALPAVGLLVLFLVLPALESLRLSLFDWDGVGEARFVGIGNFERLIGGPEFTAALAHTLLFAAVVTVGTVTVGALLAAAIDRRVRAWSLFKFVFFLPVIIPMTVTGIFWAGALDVHFGAVNQLLRSVTPGLAAPWLAEPDTALPAIMFVAIWQFAGFPMIILLAAMQSISADIHESATLEGVSAARRLTTITLPLIKPVVATVVLLQLIWSFNVFDIVWVMTRGGPGEATSVLGTLIYRRAFGLGDLGGASAAAVVSSVAIVTVSLVYLRLFRPAAMQDAP